MPSVVPAPVRSRPSPALAMPKSATSTRPSAESRTLAGFTSRWTMPAAWAAGEGVGDLGHHGGGRRPASNRPRRSSSARRVVPRTSSMTIASVLAVARCRCRRSTTIDGWARRAAATASRRNRATNCSSAAEVGVEELHRHRRGRGPRRRPPTPRPCRRWRCAARAGTGRRSAAGAGPALAAERAGRRAGVGVHGGREP